MFRITCFFVLNGFLNETKRFRHINRDYTTLQNYNFAIHYKNNNLNNLYVLFQKNKENDKLLF